MNHGRSRKPLGLGDQRRSVATVAKTVAKALNSTRRTWTTLEYRPSLRPVTDGPGRVAHSYGSDAPCPLRAQSDSAYDLVHDRRSRA